MFGRDVKHKFKGQHLAESAEWWGVFNEQMRNLKERKVLPSPTRLTAEKVSTDQAENSLKDVAKESSTPAKAESLPQRAPPMPPRSKTPEPMEAQVATVSHPQEQSNTYNIPNASFANPDYYQTQTNSIPSFTTDNFSIDNRISSLSVTDRMELAMKARTQQVEIPSEVPSFDYRPPTDQQPKPPTNPWDTFEADQAKW
jgi:hypothetical protein